MKNQRLFLPILIGIGIISIFFNLPYANAEIQRDDPISLQYFYQPGCDVCEEKEGYIDQLKANHPSLNLTKIAVIYGENHSEYFAYLESLGIPRISPPIAIFFKGECYYELHGDNFTQANLEKWYGRFEELEGECPDWSKIDTPTISPWLVFLTGFLTGLSPCVVLITAVVSSTLLMQTKEEEEDGGHNESDRRPGKKSIRKIIPNQVNTTDAIPPTHETGENDEAPIILNTKPHLAPIFFGFICGVLTMYILLGIALVTTFSTVSATFFSQPLRMGLGIILFILGFWYIADAFNPESKLFKTPDGLKKWFKTTAQKGTFLYAFTLGFVFSFIKIPCVGTILIALLLGVQSDPASLWTELVLFYIGILIPLILVMLLLSYGVRSDKIETIRVKYRPWIRIASGLTIIGLTIYALFL